MKGIAILERLCGGNVGGGGGGGGSSSGAIVLPNTSVVGTTYCQWTIGFDGFTYRRNTSGASIKSVAWISPQTGMNLYEVEVTVLDGDVPPGPLSSWINMGDSSVRTWGWTNQVAEKSCDLQVQIRDVATHTVISTTTTSLFNSGIQ